MKQFEISSKEAGQRMDKWLFKVMDQAPKSFVYKMLRKKNIVLNDKKATGQEVLSASDTVKIYLADDTFSKFATQKKPQTEKKTEHKAPVRLQVVYEDDDILVINKPSGVLSQKAKPQDYSANEMIIDYLLQKGELTEEELMRFKPSICNRLDRNTSGLLIAGKTMHGLQSMANLLQTREMEKYYLCLVYGNLLKEEHLTGYLVKDEKTNKVSISQSANGEDAAFIETAYRPISHHGNATLLEVHLITGRSHQIRAHLSSIGHPILGDEKYGNHKRNEELKKGCGIRSQLLHAYRMVFPDGKEITCPPPGPFMKAEKWLEKQK